MAPDVSKILCIVRRFSSFKPGPTKPLARCQVESVHFFQSVFLRSRRSSLYLPFRVTWIPGRWY